MQKARFENYELNNCACDQKYQNAPLDVVQAMVNIYTDSQELNEESHSFINQDG